MAPWSSRCKAAAILVVRSASDIAPLVTLCVKLGVSDLEVLRAEAAPDRVAALMERLWSCGRFGLATAGISALCGLVAAALLLSEPGLGAPIRGGGPWAMTCVALGGAVSFMPVGLPLGAILEKWRVEGLRRRYEALRQAGCSFVLVRGTEMAVAHLMWVTSTYAIDARRCRP